MIKKPVNFNVYGLFDHSIEILNKSLTFQISYRIYRIMIDTSRRLLYNKAVRNRPLAHKER